jgi:hypothetical protein
MQERRSQRRITDAELVMIVWDDNGTRLCQVGNEENLSANGVGIIADYSLAVGTPVAITYGEGELAGVVRRCAPTLEGHLVGVEFVGSSRESELVRLRR